MELVQAPDTASSIRNASSLFPPYLLSLLYPPNQGEIQMCLVGCLLAYFNHFSRNCPVLRTQVISPLGFQIGLFILLPDLISLLSSPSTNSLKCQCCWEVGGSIVTCEGGDLSDGFFLPILSLPSLPPTLFSVLSSFFLFLFCNVKSTYPGRVSL